MIMPTPKTIAAFFNLSMPEARKIRRALENRAAVNIPMGGVINRAHDLALHYANEAIGGHGVEPVRGEWSNGYWCDVRALYINTGDVYNATFVYDREKNRIYCTTLGDFCEALRRGGEQYE